MNQITNGFLALVGLLFLIYMAIFLLVIESSYIIHFGPFHIVILQERSRWFDRV
jgi:hypothetical protein